MAWKQIGNHAYYYKSRREGGRVVTEYVGRGQVASLIAQMDALTREDRELEREEREAIEDRERELAAWSDRVETLATAAMIAAGFHKHKGQWRRRRDARDDRAGTQ